MRRAHSARRHSCPDARDRDSARSVFPPWRLPVKDSSIAPRSSPPNHCRRLFHVSHHQEARMAYHLEGRLLEVCNCRVLCPCWIGEDPDNGTCDTIVGWHFDKGAIEGVDVSGRTIALIAHVPGNILQGNWKAAVYVDDKASPQQKDAILKVYTGKLGGPVGDLVKLIGEVVSVESVPIKFTVEGGKGIIEVGDAGYAELEPYRSASGKTTTLTD